MKVVITGASGFIGRYLIKELIKYNYEILAIYRSNPPIKEKNVKYEKLDLNDHPKLLNVISNFKPKLAVHCAAYIPLSQNKREENISRLDNFKATESFLNALKKCNLEKFVFLSSVSIFSSRNLLSNGSLIKENDFPNTRDFYGKDKSDSEEICIKYVRNKLINTNLIILRLTGVHGMERKNGVIFNFIRKSLNSRTIEIPSPFSQISFLHIIDAVRGIRLALQLESINKIEVINLAGEEKINLIELAQKINLLIDSKSQIIKGNLTPESWLMSTQKANEILGFKATPIDIWLKEEINLQKKIK